MWVNESFCGHLYSVVSLHHVAAGSFSDLQLPSCTSPAQTELLGAIGHCRQGSAAQEGRRSRPSRATTRKSHFAWAPPPPPPSVRTLFVSNTIMSPGKDHTKQFQHISGSQVSSFLKGTVHPPKMEMQLTIHLHVKSLWSKVEAQRSRNYLKRFYLHPL